MSGTALSPAPRSRARKAAEDSRPSAKATPPLRREAVLWTVGVAAGLLVLSLLVVLWAGTLPGFDPYGWLVWGHQTIFGSLNTNAAPSWKPLAYLFTLPYAVFGHLESWLWMITAVAVALAGVIFAGRLAYRVTAGEGGSRPVALAAAAFAGVALMEIADYPHYILSGQSDPMIVSLVLAAIDCHLCRRFRWALALGTLAALGRPEVWPFLGAYMIWAWLARPALRWAVLTCLVALAVLWFGIPALTSRTPFVAASNALGSGRALHSDRVLGTIGRFTSLHEIPLEVVALISAALAAWRRDRVTVALAAGVVVWVAVEIAFSLHGWPGLPRYMFEAAGVMVVVAAVGVGRLLVLAPRLGRIAGWAGFAVAAAVAATLVPTGITQARVERSDLQVQRQRAVKLDNLAATIHALGGAARIRSCGEPLTRLEFQTAVAWQLQINVATVGFKYGQALAHGNPVVMLTPKGLGWKVKAAHQRLAACRSLPH